MYAQGRTVCHLYYVAPGEGGELTRAFNEAFKAAAAEEQKYELHSVPICSSDGRCRRRQINPFAPISPDREPVKGVLFVKQIHRADLKVNLAFLKQIRLTLVFRR